MDYNKIEDSIFKKAMEIFKNSATEFFNLNVEIDRPAETEIKNIDIRTNAMDYLFYTKCNNYLHFEFQTTNKRDDLARFLYYDASLYYKTRKNIKTLVVYSSGIKDIDVSLNCGSLIYNIEAFYMSNLNGDDILQELKEKVKCGKELVEQDIMKLSFMPLMKSNKEVSKRTLECIEFANNIENEKDKIKSLTLLYALFDKFGDEISKRRFKEVVSMTDVGRMIYEDGVAEGMEKGKAKGKAEGKAEFLLTLLMKKFKKVPQNYKDKIKSLPVETLDLIGTDIFELEKVTDLEKYFE